MSKSRKNAVNTVSVKEKLGSFRLPVHQAISVSVDGNGKIDLQNVNNYFVSMTITKEELNILNQRIFGRGFEADHVDALVEEFKKLELIYPPKSDIIRDITKLMISKGHGPEHAKAYVNDWVLSIVELTRAL